MAKNNVPFSSLADPNSILGPNFLPKVGSAVAGIPSTVANLPTTISNLGPSSLISTRGYGQPQPAQATQVPTVLPSGRTIGYDEFANARDSRTGVPRGRMVPEPTLGPPPPPQQFSSSLGLNYGMGSPNYGSSFGSIGPSSTSGFATPQGRGIYGGSQGPSTLGLTGGTYGSGAGLGSVGLPQPNIFEQASGLFPMASPSAPSLFNKTGTAQYAQNGQLAYNYAGPLSLNINAPQTATEQGRQEIKTPYGSMWATAGQAGNFNTMRPQQRTPEQQDAMLAQVRSNALESNKARTAMVDTASRDYFASQTTPKSGTGFAPPTNMFGQPLKGFYEGRTGPSLDTRGFAQPTTTQPQSSASAYKGASDRRKKKQAEAASDSGVAYGTPDVSRLDMFNQPAPIFPSSAFNPMGQSSFGI